MLSDQHPVRDLRGACGPQFKVLRVLAHLGVPHVVVKTAADRAGRLALVATASHSRQAAGDRELQELGVGALLDLHTWFGRGRWRWRWRWRWRGGGVKGRQWQGSGRPSKGCGRRWK